MNAQQSYREAGVLGARPVELVVRLYEKMIDDLRRVSDAIEKSDLRTRTDRSKHAILIVGHLESSLDFEKGRKVARDLELFYKALRFRLLHLQFHPAKQEVAQMITDLLAVRGAWLEVERAESAPAAPAGTGAGADSYSAVGLDSERSHTSWRG